MNDQYVPTDSSDDNEPPFVYLSQLMFSKLAEVGVAAPSFIQVMLALTKSLDPDGCVEVSLAEVVQQCNTPLKKVKAGILGLAGAELIESLNLSALAAGTVSCRMSPDLVRYGKSKGPSFPLGTPSQAE
ncbi:MULTISPECIES: hypothetical protein [Pseudomonas]|uniref:hypothetical protein n=1 Tax=Pseudomonas TaxID=286 RepID=UPI000F76D0F4|nr:MULTISPECIES: hypothetical protein [Pseudomonas]MDM9587183.1 hypothetical protein [Pseudomonas asiatica]RRV63118.1 hypothetical protein EGJ15_18495 [Pseudomonas sp. p99-361]